MLAKFTAVFDSYWASGDFVPYESGQFEQERERAGRTDHGPHVILSPIELRPHPFQERLLELLVVFKGGTALRKFFAGAAGRFSTDLDFAIASATDDRSTVADVIAGLLDEATVGPFRDDATARQVGGLGHQPNSVTSRSR